MHLWYQDPPGIAVEPLRSSAEAVSTWPETATTVAIHLDAADRLKIVAPFGLDDLFATVVRHNPTRATASAYNRRLASKRFTERWPRVSVGPA